MPACSRKYRVHHVIALGVALLIANYVALQAADVPTSAPAAPQATTQPLKARVVADSDIERGRYLVIIGGCNDCHTPGFMEKGFAVPETEWLTGMHVGFRGAWGTTYGSNLRIFVRHFPEDLFVQVLRERKARPPMPWTALNAMSDDDLRAMHKYIKSLKPLGKHAPLFVPPNQEPKTPYFDYVPKMPATTQAVEPAK